MLSQEEMIQKEIKNEKIKQHKQLILKSIVMILIFYILYSPVFRRLISKNSFLNKKIGVNMSITLLFGFIYYILHLVFI